MFSLSLMFSSSLALVPKTTSKEDEFLKNILLIKNNFLSLQHRSLALWCVKRAVLQHKNMFPIYGQTPTCFYAVSET